MTSSSVADNLLSPACRALKQRIEQWVPLELTQLHIGDQTIRWYRVADGEQLLAKAAQGRGRAEEIDPFWAATWRAARGLDRFLGTWKVAGVPLLELGCGSGQAGIGAALRGARVTMTDAVGMALLVARLNAWCAGLSVEIRRLKWDARLQPARQFPLIIGSDLVYDPGLFPALEWCARQHLLDGGRLLLSEPHRHTGDRFAKWIVEAGWQTREHDVDLSDARVPIRVFECWLSRSATHVSQPPSVD